MKEAKPAINADASEFHSEVGLLGLSNTNKDITRTMTLPNEVKEGLEEVINDWLLRFDEIAESEFYFLEAVGLEPKLETLVSYTIGVLDSIVGGYIHCSYNRGMTEDEDAELIKLLQGKIPAFEHKFKLFLNEE